MNIKIIIGLNFREYETRRERKRKWEQTQNENRNGIGKVPFSIELILLRKKFNLRNELTFQKISYYFYDVKVGSFWRKIDRPRDGKVNGNEKWNGNWNGKGNGVGTKE